MSAFATATEKSYWPLVSAQLKAAAPFMIATHERNLDNDCRAISELKFAAKTTDAVESQFATYDYVLKLRAGHGATAGVAQAIRMHAMASPGETQAKAAQQVKEKRKRKLGGEASEAEQIALHVKRWEVTSFFELPKEKRWAIILSVRKAYQVSFFFHCSTSTAVTC